MIVHPSTKDEWGSKIENMIANTDGPFIVLAIDNDHSHYIEAVARVRRIDVPYYVYLMREADYNEMFCKRDNDYESGPCIQVFSQGINTGHYTIDELLKQTELTVEFILEDLGQRVE